jgi:hypothetical protein
MPILRQENESAFAFVHRSLQIPIKSTFYLKCNVRCGIYQNIYRGAIQKDHKLPTQNFDRGLHDT